MKREELTPIELECNMGPDVNGVVQREPWKAYDIDEVNRLLDEKDAEIAALKKKLMPCLNGDCILTCDTVEKYGKENAALKAEINRKEAVGKRWFERCMEARAENIGLKRALWLVRVELCHWLDVDRYLRNHRNSWYNENCLTWNDACVAMEVKMCKAENKCRAKAEEYK